jgi:hypothetical protein
MNQKDIRFALNEVLNHAENARCEHLHHSKKNQHEAGCACPVERNLHKQAHIVREYIRIHGI